MLIILRVFLATGLAATLALGIADGLKHSSGAELVRLGLRVTPGDSKAWMRIGAMREASVANPRESAAWIALGLQAEAAGNLTEAGQELARAMEVDRGFLPVWTMANFYLRHGDARYRPLLRKALAIGIAGDQDVGGVFDAAWQAGDDIAGGDPEATKRYVTYLIGAGHSEAIFAAAKRVSDPALRLRSADWLMSAGRETECRRLTGAIVFNSELKPPGEWSFDWKYNTAPEHTFDFEGGERGVRIDLNGGQPERIDLMSERIALEAGRRYRLSWRTEIAAWGKPTLSWAVAGTTVNAAASGSADFVGAPGARLVLRLERTVGERAFTGTIWMGRPSIDAVGEE